MPEIHLKVLHGCLASSIFEICLKIFMMHLGTFVKRTELKYLRETI